MRKVALGVSGGVVLLSGAMFGSALSNSGKKPEVHPERFSALAKKYDKEVGGTEESIGIEKARASLIAKARGRVLETCAGTGRNNKFYDGSKVEELTLVDASEEMLKEAVNKPVNQPIKLQLIKTRSLKHFSDDSFDCVVDTFGICSVENPSEFLQEVHRILKPGGTALFLEHGKSESDSMPSRLMNIWLEFRAYPHATYFGCVWNREILGLVSNSTLKVQSKSVEHFGTLTSIEATK